MILLILILNMARIAINGFGRIGRLFLRQVFESGNKNLQIAAINDLGDIDNLAYLVKYDSVYRTFNGTVEVKKNPNGVGGELIINGSSIAIVQEKDPAKLPWGALNIDVAVESTGLFESFEKSRAHVAAGAKRVVITAPAKDGEMADAKTVLMGVNEDQMGKCVITSNGSCTTNATHPVMAILSENPGIEKAMLSTVHGYTATQNLVDGPTKGSDYRRGRAAGANITPSFTGATVSVTRALPELEGKFDGLAYRVPIITGSLADITFVAKKNTTVEEINDILKTAAASPRWKEIITTTEDQLVSSDVIGSPYGAIIDLKFTKVIGGNLVKVLSWYDNEYGYVSTLVKHVAKVVENL